MQQGPGKPSPAASTGHVSGKSIQEGQPQGSCVQATNLPLAKHLESCPAEAIAT